MSNEKYKSSNYILFYVYHEYLKKIRYDTDNTIYKRQV